MLRSKNIVLSLLTVFALVIALSGCEKEVHINIASSASQVVVQGAVETGAPPYVFLSSTIGFFSKMDLNTLENSFLHGAVITVSDGTNTITLKEYTFDTGGTSKFYVYSVDPASGTMVGEVGKYYTLNVIYNGKTYTSVTKIPAPKGIDSIWVDVPLYVSAKTPDSAKQLFVNYTDPDTPGNYVRYYTQRNGGLFYPSDQFNDQVVNGKPITDIPLYAGYEHTQDVNNDSMMYFYPGDTLTLKWSEIDKNVYNFWNSYAYALNALGNPFASPINLQTNITNGGLGVWGGYGSLTYTLIVH